MVTDELCPEGILCVACTVLRDEYREPIPLVALPRDPIKPFRVNLPPEVVLGGILWSRKPCKKACRIRREACQAPGIVVQPKEIGEPPFPQRIFGADRLHESSLGHAYREQVARRERPGPTRPRELPQTPEPAAGRQTLGGHLQPTMFSRTECSVQGVRVQSPEVREAPVSRRAWPSGTGGQRNILLEELSGPELHNWCPQAQV